MTQQNRHILMLQGPSSPFFAHLGVALKLRGATVTRIGFCPGDRLYWRKSAGEYIAYTGRADAWQDFAQALINERKITDLVMLGDGRKLHAQAIAASKSVQPRATPWIVEHGYLRPDLLTIEPWGTGGRSRVKAQYRPTQDPPDHLPRFDSSFTQFALLDTGYHIANLLTGWALYPRYRNHAIFPQYQEWAGWIRKGILARRRRRLAAEAMAKLDPNGPQFLFPLQLETDYQIRDHGPAGGVQATLDRVITGFAKDAPSSAQLIVKAHPMDNGLTGWGQKTRSAARANGVWDRVIYLDGGDLDQMLTQAAGCVTINSTVGLSAAQMGCPVKTLGTAIYDMAGITSPGDLGTFFNAPTPPDPMIVDAFTNFLHKTVLVPGAFDGAGVSTGAENVADKILAGPVFVEDAT